VLTKWERGKGYTMVQNEKYATGPKPILKTINVTVVAPTAGLAPTRGQPRRPRLQWDPRR
jgi:hypothetical protein